VGSRSQIVELLYRYQTYRDAGDLGRACGLFAHAVLRATDGTAWVGAAGAEAMFRGAVRDADRPPRETHVTTNPIVEVDEAAGTATCRSVGLTFQQPPGRPLDVMVAGRYHDRFERVDGIWRFAERAFLVDLVGDLSHHRPA
jgi:hypothetical protein